MKNNLTDKDIETLKKWGKEYDIYGLRLKDKERFFNLHGLLIADDSNKIKYIPTEIFKLTNLEVLSIDVDELTELPKDIENLTKLKELSINSVALTELPKEIGNLTNLKCLDIRCQNLKRLPEEIYNLINLEEVTIHCDNLENFPDGIEKLINLDALIIINHNETWNIKKLPIDGIGKLTKLKRFCISRVEDNL